MFDLSDSEVIGLYSKPMYMILPGLNMLVFLNVPSSAYVIFPTGSFRNIDSLRWKVMTLFIGRGMPFSSSFSSNQILRLSLEFNVVSNRFKADKFLAIEVWSAILLPQTHFDAVVAFTPRLQIQLVDYVV